MELYKRLIKPVTLVAMILLAMLFIFGSTRDITLGRKIFFGVALGLSFEMLSRIASAMALSFDFNPLMSAILPSSYSNAYFNNFVNSKIYELIR